MKVNKQHENEMQLANVLMIEDNPSDIFLTKTLLDHEKVCLNLITYEDGIEALEFIESMVGKEDSELERLDLLLMDLNMPTIDGTEILKRLAKFEINHRTIPVVVLSGSESNRDIEMVHELGASGYVVKPISKAKIEYIVEKIDSLELKYDGNKYLLCAIE